MQPVTKLDKKFGVYLPYHEVTREDKTTTKVRIVFNASSKGTNGVSLNDNLMVGPTLQPELRHAIMRWRTYPICLTADIIKMYRQILVTEEDADFQRILWREDPKQDVGEYKLLRLTFGTSSAPYLAVKTLIQLAEDEGKGYELTTKRIKRDFYVDDFMSGCQTKEEALKIYEEINLILNKGGFTLQKWNSNDEEVRKMFNGKEKSDEEKELDDRYEVKNKILGLTWNTKRDEFDYAVQLPPITYPVTKRMVVSDIARLYDPLGWIAPSIVIAKILIQKLWLSGIQWDEELPQNLLYEWIAYRKDLELLTQFRLPRWVMSSHTDQVMELHGFCDASNVAFGAVVYLRIIDVNGEVHVNLITAKTRVAPIKQVSIPRLELCGAVLLTKLLVEVSQVLDIPKSHIFAWTDSEVVLAWLSAHPSKWKTFIANRVAEIITHLDRSQWHYVKSQLNPADGASKGIKTAELVHHKLWLHGPPWLNEEIVTYTQPNNNHTILEERKSLVHVATSENDDDSIWWKFSSLTKLLRVVAYCRRFLRRNNNRKNHTYLLKKEITEALNIMIRKCQSKEYSQEIQCLKGGQLNKNQNLPPSLQS